MTVMNWLIDNWFVLLAIAALAAMVGAFIWRFGSMPTQEQTAKVKEWLLWAVTQAEIDLGGGTGKLKLRQVYDLFVQRFPWLVKVVSFERFSELVDEALEEMRNMLATNTAVKKIVEGDAGNE